MAAAELPRLEIEVSVLTPLEPVPVAGDGEAEALAALRPGVDGLLLEAAGRRAVFIPAMWEELPDPAQFLGHLRRKAGLPQRLGAGHPATALHRRALPGGGAGGRPGGGAAMTAAALHPARWWHRARRTAASSATSARATAG